VPPRMNTSFDSLWGNTVNSKVFQESSTWKTIILTLRIECSLRIRIVQPAVCRARGAPHQHLSFHALCFSAQSGHALWQKPLIVTSSLKLCVSRICYKHVRHKRFDLEAKSIRWHQIDRLKMHMPSQGSAFAHCQEKQIIISSQGVLRLRRDSQLSSKNFLQFS